MADKDYASLAKKHNGVSSPAQSTEKQYESPDAVIPPEIERIQHAVGANFVQGKPFKGYGGEGVIASVAQGEPHQIEINDKGRWNQAPKQELAHELVHLWQSQLPGPLRNAAPPDDPNHPYDMSKIDEWRAQGKNLSSIPREVAARVIQTWVADPSQRKRLQPWVDDLTKIPMSVMQPTGPNDKTINRTPRAPLPPPEAYSNPTALMAEAKKRAPIAPQKLGSETMAVSHPKGLVEAGNLPIWNRPSVKNADGSHSTEYSTSFRDDKGREVLVPTVVNGKFLTPDGKKPREGSPEEKAMFRTAWQHYRDTGENLGKFDNPADANAYAGILHKRGQRK